MHDPFVALSYLMTRTEKIALGVGITNPFQRHPIQIARAAVTLADMRPGGFVLGLGAGEKRRIRDRVGAPTGPSDTNSVTKKVPDLFDGKKVSVSNSVFELDKWGSKSSNRRRSLSSGDNAPGRFSRRRRPRDGVIVGDVADPAAQQIVDWIRRANSQVGYERYSVLLGSNDCCRGSGCGDRHLRRPVIDPRSMACIKRHVVDGRLAETFSENSCGEV